jgi:hypothetical protein
MKQKIPRKIKKELKKLEIVAVHPSQLTDPFDSGFRGIRVHGKVNKRTRKVIARVMFEYKRWEQMRAQEMFQQMINARANNNN